MSDVYIAQFHNDQQTQAQINAALRSLYGALADMGEAVAFADLPAAADNAGARRLISDSDTPSFGDVVVDGGSLTAPVYSDGSDWRWG